MSNKVSIRTVTDFVNAIEHKWNSWGKAHPVWFRGESDWGRDEHAQKGHVVPLPLCPRIHAHNSRQENYLLQTFRRKAGGFANMPPFERTDLWLFRAQHYNVPTRLLDWSEGALLALFFAINENKVNPRVYMLHPHRLNALACDELIEIHGTVNDRSFERVMGLRREVDEPLDRYRARIRNAVMMVRKVKEDACNFPLTWKGGSLPAIGYVNIAPAWEERGEKSGRTGIRTPIAIPATYQDTRMIAQRSCFTIHGKSLISITDIVTSRTDGNLEYCLKEFPIDPESRDQILEELNMLGITRSSIYPDLDRLGYDLAKEAKRLEC